MLCCAGGSAQCKPNIAEWQVWKKSLQCAGFPHRDVIDEFLVNKDKLPLRALVWKRPKMFHLMVYKFILANYFHQVMSLHFEMTMHSIFWHQ